MGFFLLWLFHWIIILLAMATLTACVARLERRRWRRIWFTVLLIPGILYTGGMAVWTGYIHFGTAIRTVPFVPPATMFVLFLLLSAWMGRKISASDDGLPAAATWPRLRLTGGTSVALAAIAVTYGSLDYSAQGRIAKVRSDANEELQSLLPPPAPDADNAAKIYVTLEIDEDGLSVEATDVLSGQRPLKEYETEIREHLAKNQDELEKIRAAAQLPSCDFERPYHEGLSMLMPEIEQVHTAGRLLGFSAEIFIAEGNFQAAIEDINAMARVAEHVADHTILVPVLVGVTVQGMADQAVVRLLNIKSITTDNLKHLDSNHGKSFVGAYHHAMLMEKAIHVIWICTIFNPGPGENWNLTGSFASPDAKRREAPRRSLFRVYLADRELRAYREAMNNLTPLIVQPPHEARETLDQLMEQTANSKSSILVDLLLPGFDGLYKLAYTADTKTDLLRIAIAARRYQLSEGQLPTTLNQLTPKWIDKIPIDPFDGKPLKLEQDEHSWTVYSVVREEQEDEDDVGEVTLKKH